MLKVKVTTILFMILSAMQLHCMMPARRALQQIPVRSMLAQSVRSLTLHHKLCICQFPACHINDPDNRRRWCKADVVDDVVLYTSDGVTDYLYAIYDVTDYKSDKPYSAAATVSSGIRFDDYERRSGRVGSVISDSHDVDSDGDFDCDWD